MDTVGQEVAFAGRRIKQKICAALAVSSVIPLLVLAYSIYAHVMPMLDPDRHARDLVWIQALLVFTGLLMAAGAFVIWDLALAVSRTAHAVATPRDLEAAATARSDEVGVLMGSFSRMLHTIETQAQAINEFTGRLEGAYRELELTNARLKEFSFKDDVTGLYNRRFFSVRLDEEVSRYRRFNHPVSVAMLDIDGFKSINDAFGHAAGDAALRRVGDTLARHSRGINVICRYGGDEFAVLLVETSKEGARSYAERIRQVLAATPIAEGQSLTVSIGVASLPDDVAPSPEELTRAADEALYAAKRAGRNRVAAWEEAIAPGDVEAQIA